MTGYPDNHISTIYISDGLKLREAKVNMIMSNLPTGTKKIHRSKDLWKLTTIQRNTITYLHPPCTLTGIESTRGTSQVAEG